MTYFESRTAFQDVRTPTLVIGYLILMVIRHIQSHGILLLRDYLFMHPQHYPPPHPEDSSALLDTSRCDLW
jgi:hypothetical protein